MSSLDIVRSQNLAQIASLVTNPVFLNMVKSATKSTGNESGKYDSLFEQLEKLGDILAAQNTSESGTETSSATQAAGTASGMSETELLLLANMLQNQSLGQVVDDLISKADMLEAMLDLEIIPPDDIVADFFGKLAEIISKLDGELRQNNKAQLDKKIKEQITLAPSSDTKSGFQEGLKLVVQ